MVIHTRRLEYAGFEVDITIPRCRRHHGGEKEEERCAVAVLTTFIIVIILTPLGSLVPNSFQHHDMVCENQRLLDTTLKEDISGCFVPVLDQVVPSHFLLSLPMHLAFRISRSAIILLNVFCVGSVLATRLRRQWFERSRHRRQTVGQNPIEFIRTTSANRENSCKAARLLRLRSGPVRDHAPIQLLHLVAFFL